MFYVENPNVGKTTAVHRLQTITMIVNVCTTVKLRGNDLELTIFATGGGNTQRQRPLTLSLSIALFTLAPTRVAIHNEQHYCSSNKQFALGHIYTNMTFGLFTNIASTALGNIFTNMSPHPVSTSHRARIFIRFRNRVLFIRSLPGILHHPVP